MKDSIEFRQRFADWKAGKKVYDAGKPVEDDYEKFKQTLPPNQRNTSEYEYSTRRYWELNGKPKNFDEAVKKGMYSLEDDGFYHASSIAWTPEGDAEFMKPNVHPTKHFEDEFYESNPEFQKKYRRTFDWTRPGFSKYERNISPLDHINLPKYDNGTDDKTYLPEYEYEATVTPEGTSLEKHKRITNEEDWQKYWGNVGVGYVSQAQEAAAPVVLNGMSMLMGNPVGALAGIIGSEVGKSAGAQISPTAEAIGGLAGGMVLNPELWLNLPSYLRSGYNFVNHGFRGSSEILPVTGRPNTLRRFVGVGTSGLDDAVESGIIRGKTEHPVPHTAHQLTRYNKRLHEASVADDVIRRFNSGELTESDWNIVAPILNDQERVFGFKSRLLRRMPLSDSFENYQREIRNQRLANKLIQDKWDLYGPTDDWSGNWNGHNMATFAEYGERLSNKDIFPGDFAVEIQNADKWARDASGYGHNPIHPVSYRPIEWNNSDVTWYEKAYGLLDKQPYMRKANPASIEAAIQRAWDRLNTYDKGKSIHINPANKGKFNATKKRTGKTTEQLAHSKNPLTRKRAVFALNARKWKR